METLQMPIKIYTEKTADLFANSASLNPIINVLINEPTRLEHLKVGDARATQFTLCNSIAEADIYCLPMIWGHYLKNNLVHQASDAIHLAIAHNKPVIIFSQGDAPARLPFSGTHVFENSTYKSNCNRDGNTHYGYPAIIRDYKKLYSIEELVFREKAARPSIGFCGQASDSIAEFLWHELLRRYKKFRFDSGLSAYEPPPFETVMYRSKVLNTLKRYSQVDTNFILRKQYRAGNKPEVKNPAHPVRREFVQNILDTDYTVCIRGGGNYSVRFYETLCLGRIPIFVNTDCLLPFEDEIKYQDYFVWVEEADINMIGEKVTQFHEQFSVSEFFNAQQKCRNLWVEYFSTRGYFNKLTQLIQRIIKG